MENFWKSFCKISGGSFEHISCIFKDIPGDISEIAGTISKKNRVGTSVGITKEMYQRMLGEILERFSDEMSVEFVEKFEEKCLKSFIEEFPKKD